MELPEVQKKAFDEFYNSARNNKVLDKKTTVMIHLASAMAVACHPCVQHYLSQVEEVGITGVEVGVIQAIVMAVSGGRVRAQFREEKG
jgi:alkylhydroperoxidase/carboxymuconolactone decarboxylase family protein YurZ